MPTTTRVVIQDRKDGPIELREVTLPDPGPHDVLVAIEASGVCQSQLFWMHVDHPNPMLFGHEGYGTVVALGADVTNVREGERVMVTWIPRQGDRVPAPASISLTGGTTAISPNVYTWAEHTLVDELYIVPLPPAVQQDVTSIVGCAVVTGAGAVCNSAPVNPGDTVAVFGVGGVGLSAVAGARIRGASQIVAVDLDANKLEFAKHFGATDTVNATTVSDPAAAIIELTGGVDVAVDCVGHQSTTGQALDCVRSGQVGGTHGGTAVLVGVPKEPMTLDLSSLFTGQKKLVGTTGGGCTQDDITMFLDWYHRGLLDLNTLVTDRYPLESIEQAVSDLATGKILGRALVTI
ncbi:zinc-binding dehydrogenase [Rhodococcus sp. NPDC056960]|uniref:zinc-binding dehydrogenase n=1 Tax=Rhodococcus sp. NPDC056960 TaxID=3345982 RepID=UPI003628868B